jgi:hypothetical protein
MFAMRLLRGLALVGVVVAQDVDYAHFVNPFIGSEGAIPGYACKLTFANSAVSLTNNSRWWRCLCGRYSAVWYGQVGPRHI